MPNPFKILVGDTVTPQARVPKTGTQEYAAPVTVGASSGEEVCFEIEATIAQSGTAGYRALKITVVEGSIGSGDRIPFDIDVGGASVFSVDYDGDALASSLNLSASTALLLSNANGSILRRTNDSGVVQLHGGTSLLDGPTLLLYGQNQGVKPGDIEFWGSGGSALRFYDNFAYWDFNANEIVTTGFIRPAGWTGPKWTSGAGTPEGSLSAAVGSMYTRTDGGAGTTLYIKESGTGNTGWVAK